VRLPDGSALYQGSPIGDIAAGRRLPRRPPGDRPDRAHRPLRRSLALPPAHYDANHPDNAVDSTIPAIFDSLKKSGLQLQSGKAPTGGLILDHIEKPAED
jgi:hypothetical protein